MPTLLHRYIDSLLDSPAGDPADLRRSEYTLWQRYWMLLTGLRPRTTSLGISASGRRRVDPSKTASVTWLPTPRPGSTPVKALDCPGERVSLAATASPAKPRSQAMRRPSVVHAHKAGKINPALAIAIGTFVASTVLAVVVALITGHTPAQQPSNPVPPPGEPAPAPSPIGSSASPGLVITEFTNNSQVPVFTSPNGPVIVGDIPYATRLQVACFTSNQSGIADINDFYLITTPPWRGLYAPANAFTNGAEIGSPDAPIIDPSVPRCKI
jgi:hypothetical protein